MTETSPVLIVDLDGTLLRSDMLFETFWAACSKDWRTPVACVRALKNGRAELKHMLSERSHVDESTLPYDPQVIEYINKFRAKGGRAALVTASNQVLAQRIANHLQIFDEVHGSDRERNLKGDKKAAFLVDRFGQGGFSYMGDSQADLAVWKKAKDAIAVNAAPAIHKKLESLGIPVVHLQTVPVSKEPFIKALRPHQWLKNVLVFLPMLAAHKFELAVFVQSLFAFFAFCLVASSVYVLNDLLDLKADRAHPRKCLRPFASGSLPIQMGSGMAGGLLGSGLLISVFLGPTFFMIMLFYFLLTGAYSLFLKRQIVIDICVLAGLYTMRIIAGGGATDIVLSVWLLAFSIFFFFSLAAVKRQAELVDMKAREELKVSGRGYHLEDLPIISMIGLASGYVSVLVMALYLNSPAVQELYTEPMGLWAICCVLLYWLTRVVMITNRGWMHDDPVVFAVKDRTSHFCFGIILAGVIYGSL